MTATRGLLEYCDPHGWSVHHFGLPASHWNALAGKAVWLTGAGTGFGAAIATMLAAANARPILTGRRREKLESAREAMRGFGVDPTAATILPCDVRDQAQLGRATSEIVRSFGSLHGLVVCAALPQPRPTPWPLADLAPESWQSLMDTNLTAPWLTARAALPLMLDAAQARVVLLTS